MRQIGGVEFDDDRIVITFMDPDQDIRNKGLVMQTHQIVVLRSPAYADEIDALEEAAKELLEDAYGDFQDTDPVAATPVADLDDEGDEDG